VLAGDPTAPALVEAESGTTLTFATLSDAVHSLAGQLAALGVGRGDRVALVIPDGPDFIRLLLAVNVLGAAAAPLNPAYKRDEYAFYLEDLQPRLLLLPEGGLPAAREAAGPGVRVVDVEQLAGEEAPFEPARPDDVALLLHTSGTTSRPKQVPLTHANLVASARTIVEHYGLTRDDVSHVAMPLFHVHGLVASTLSPLLAGGAVVVPRRFAPRRFWPQARAHGVTWFSAGPTLHQMILDRADVEGPPPSLRFARSCSSALSPALMQRLEDTLGVPMLEAYGMTEASHQMASNPLPPEPRIPGTVGVPTGTEIRIGDAGEVLIRGPGVMRGYLNNPQANEESFVDGWFRTGDRGVFEDGYLRLQGRLKEMILRGGENISPYEIEDVLKTHPAVADAVCFGVDDERYGEKVGAAIVLSGEAGERELAEYCRERLAAFKVPEVIRIVEEIPRTPTGKVQRKRVGEAVL
jgi:acyl-CoA synthetase (AMP-forming)/AMP-acid ligase II